MPPRASHPRTSRHRLVTGVASSQEKLRTSIPSFCLSRCLHSPIVRGSPSLSLCYKSLFSLSHLQDFMSFILGGRCWISPCFHGTTSPLASLGLTSLPGFSQFTLVRRLRRECLSSPRFSRYSPHVTFVLFIVLCHNKHLAQSVYVVTHTQHNWRTRKDETRERTG